ncbi:HNH endonuclease [Stenotrophomonas rhizophila]|uniref:HNH endonuclease n=1 Tax=Stenotrophomonas rhizophila TaxID=216778 RepID=UPI000F4D293E|nr:HNH endonuclease signature motif containing protein [Stenotrophomonas rhizophila]ROP73298.1 HNH endonuclease [Stenotrophomonas rhizophila]
MTITVAALRELSIFDELAAKVVTATDVARGAYVLTKDQVRVLAAAGRNPQHDESFMIMVAFDAELNAAEASYYEAARSTRASRRPEPRMGREIISAWMKLGDCVAIGGIGAELYAFRMSDCPADLEEFISSFAPLIPKQVAARAKVTAPAERCVVQRVTFLRNPWVVASALLRANGACEMPNCEETLIIRDDGKPYLEVHHIDPLSNGGPDVLSNVAALCPRCHRFLHHGQGRAIASRSLVGAIRKTIV